MVYEQEIPGRRRFTAHAVREIRNRLPDVVSGRRAKPTLDYKGRVQELRKAWTRAGYSPDVGSPGISCEGTTVQIPISLARKIANLVRDHGNASERPRAAAARLFEALAPENQQRRAELTPVLEQWLQVTNWFVSKAHDSGRVDAEYSWSEVVAHFEVFELSLSALIGEFFAAIDELDEILEDANS